MGKETISGGNYKDIERGWLQYFTVVIWPVNIKYICQKQRRDRVGTGPAFFRGD